MNQQQRPGMVRQAGMLGNVLSTGLTGGVCLSLSLFLGYRLDQYFDSSPYGVLGGIFLGLAAAIVQTWKQLNESMGAFKREQKRTENKTTQM